MNRIKEIREAKKMSQVELAYKLGVSQTAICKWESDKSNPKTARLRDVADALGCTVDELLRKEE